MGNETNRQCSSCEWWRQRNERADGNCELLREATGSGGICADWWERKGIESGEKKMRMFTKLVMMPSF